MNRRVVVTGLGIISSIGANIDKFWDGCLKTESQVKQIPENWLNYSNFNSRIWSPLPEMNLTGNGISKIEEKQLDMTSLMSINASFQALDHAGIKYTKTDEKRNTFRLDNINSDRSGVFLGTGVGGISTLGSCLSNQILCRQKNSLENLINTDKTPDGNCINELNLLKEKMLLPKRFNPFAVSMIMPNASSANLGIKFGINGYNNTYSSACASGTQAIGNCYKFIRSGEIDFAITGGTEFLYDDYGALFYAFDVIKALANNYSDIEKANRPFDRDHSGFLFAEGGCGILTMEELDHALERGANIIAEIAGYSETCDAFNIMMIDSKGNNISKMLNNLLKSANVKAEEIDYINAHGTGTTLNDEVETKVIEEIFGKKPLVNSTKSLLGHTLGASGAIEAIVTCLSIINNTTHISKNLDNPVRELNFVRNVSNYQIKYAISQSFGFGGHNTGILLKKYK